MIDVFFKVNPLEKKEKKILNKIKVNNESIDLIFEISCERLLK